MRSIVIRERVAPARPAGVEISAVMVEQGRARWGDSVDVHLADVATMPFEDASIDGLLSVNTIYFWPDPAAALREIRRVLKPGGRLVLGIRSKPFLLASPVSWFGFKVYSVRQLERLLREAGFETAVRRMARGELVVIGRLGTDLESIASARPEGERVRGLLTVGPPSASVQRRKVRARLLRGRRPSHGSDAAPPMSKG